MPEKINPPTIDLWLSRGTSRPPSDPPATAIIAARTDNELPHVEKNAVDAPTASAISFSASLRYWPVERQSSKPPLTNTSARKGSRPSTASTRSSAPRPWRCPGGLYPYRSCR
jgi:hypothetical protein